MILLLVFFLGGVVTYNLGNLQNITREISEVNGECVILGDRLLVSFSSLVKSVQKYYVSGDVDYYNRGQELKIGLEKDFGLMERLVESDGQGGGLISDARRLYADFVRSFEANAALIQEHGIKADLDAHDLVLEQMAAHLKGVIQANKRLIHEKTNLTNALSRHVFFVTIIITALTLLLGIIISFLNTRAITVSLSRLKKKTEEIALGRFTGLGTMEGPREIQDLFRHFNIMARRLEELDHLKGDFISHVSHELRTPVTAIKEASHMLSRGHYGDDPHKQQELYLLIHEECERLLNKVVRLLDYSKMEVRAMEYDFADFEPAGVIRRSILKLAPLAEKKKIDLEFVPPPKLPALSGDRDRILEVVDNLIGNALKFTPVHGRIQVQCLLDGERNRMVVSISDTGHGIRPEHLKAIFLKFTQIDNGIGTRMGTGLGLSISKHIIKAHGGDIWAESEQSGGTSFFFSLPLPLD